ncbi:HEAT repeat domain-containing protein [Anaerobaca lacustris]|uniref:HEAT repeat domain-containing protein n=1 Tax=Anaerobaca lacustris TaxID=3044600 RepID=UPI003D7687A4
MKLLSSGDKGTRISASVALRRDIGSTQVIKALIKGLKDRSTYVRGTAAWNLGRIGSAQAIPALCKALRDKDGEVRIVPAVVGIRPTTG